jgi:hypothetical protein
MVDVNLEARALNICHWRNGAHGSLATGMMTRTHLAVASHLLATRHFCLRHLWVGQASESRRSRP